jgi:hypothetical protein
MPTNGVSAGPIDGPATDYSPTAAESRGFFGHPRGLATLFFTEMWERFSYYGMRAFLILYMVHALNFDDKHAGSVYGTYTASAWALAIFGGIIADRWLGQYKSVLIGGISSPPETSAMLPAMGLHRFAAGDGNRNRHLKTSCTTLVRFLYGSVHPARFGLHSITSASTSVRALRR